MDAVDALAAQLERLRPLSAEQIRLLFPRWRAEDALFVYATNAIEGSTLTLGETIAVLQDGITIGGKPLRDHIDAVNGRTSFELMLSIAEGEHYIGLDDILNLHRAVVGTAPFAGRLRDHAVYIRGSLHVPPNFIKVPEQMANLVKRMHEPIHAVERAARAHFDLLTIHPFADGNGRTARLLQNLLLVKGGFVPILIRPEDRAMYFEVLQSSQTAIPGFGDPTPFISYIADFERRELVRYLRALS